MIASPLRPIALGLAAAAGCSLQPVSAPPVAHHGSDGSSVSRALTTRPLLATSTRNVLLDPFETSDASWGHFVGLALPSIVGVSARRAFVSLSPAGVSAPVASLPSPGSLEPKCASIALLAPFPGGSVPFAARIWISIDDEGGPPEAVTITLLPNDRPDQAYPLKDDGTSAVLGDRRWVRRSLPKPVPMAEGGWFSISVTDAGTRLEIQAPEVTPAGGEAPEGIPLMSARAPHHRESVAGYVEALRRATPSPW